MITYQTVKKKRYDLIYCNDSDAPDGCPISYLKSYVPHDGYYLFAVCATYAKSLKPNPYYVIARTEREAKQIFQKYYDWLDVISEVRKCGEEETEAYTTNWYENTRIVI